MHSWFPGFSFGNDQTKPVLKTAKKENRTNWSRVIMNDATKQLVRALPVETLETVEISGNAWSDFGFKSYDSVHFPAFDLCKDVLPKQYDLVIAEQVLEHVFWPYRAVKNVYDSLRPGGYFLVSTPFLVRVHNDPVDCSRWTELGLKHLLAEGGFPLEYIETGSWGNRACVVDNLASWVEYRPGEHSLVNEPELPYHVWARAKKA
jgi:SAM-dependent methyltransferase